MSLCRICRDDVHTTTAHHAWLDQHHAQLEDPACATELELELARSSAIDPLETLEA